MLQGGDKGAGRVTDPQILPSRHHFTSTRRVQNGGKLLRFKTGSSISAASPAESCSSPASRGPDGAGGEEGEAAASGPAPRDPGPPAAPAPGILPSPPVGGRAAGTGTRVGHSPAPSSGGDTNGSGRLAEEQLRGGSARATLPRRALASRGPAARARASGPRPSSPHPSSEASGFPLAPRPFESSPALSIGRASWRVRPALPQGRRAAGSRGGCTPGAPQRRMAAASLSQLPRCLCSSADPARFPPFTIRLSPRSLGDAQPRIGGARWLGGRNNKKLQIK